MKKLKEYALYKGEEILAIGTIKEIANELNISPKTVSYYKTPRYQRRLANRNCGGNVRELISLDD